MSPNLFIIIPAYNEETVIGDVVRDLCEKYPQVIVVDDGSKDQTAARARAAGALVLAHLINRGQGAALKTGIDYALAKGADILVTFDSDGQHRAADIARVIAPIVGGHMDIVLGSRFLDAQDKVPRGRRLILKLAIVFTRLVSRIRVTDTHNGFRALSRRAALAIDIRQDRMAHASEILDEITRHQLRYCEVPTQVAYTDYSRAKGQRSSAAVRIAIDFLIGKWRK